MQSCCDKIKIKRMLVFVLYLIFFSPVTVPIDMPPVKQITNPAKIGDKYEYSLAELECSHFVLFAKR